MLDAGLPARRVEIVAVHQGSPARGIEYCWESGLVVSRLKARAGHASVATQ
jgi:hypothetical protein